MRSLDKLKPNLFDLIPAAAVAALALLVALAFWRGLQRPENGIITVTFDGEIVQEISLSNAKENETLTLSNNGVTLTLALNPGGTAGAQVTSSDCPNGDCLRTGIITHSGESIVCLPARTVITLQGGAESGVDAV
ncbi:MAG: NusG domain II-containing protein, partial [Oscillospiraceae bacterium]|nr:NusG domain II-containing protein [Oscillospiraceae bacterium]